MKLHLPKLLCVAVMAAMALPAMGATFSSADIETPTEGGPSYLNVGTESGTDTWAGNLIVGDTDTTAGDVDYVGAFTDSWDWITPNGKTTITSGLKVEGNLTVQGGGKIVLGGQVSSTYNGVEATNDIAVTGGTLTATRIITNNLTVSSGRVTTSTSNCTSGNAGPYAFYYPKPSYIKNSITLTGGYLEFGYNNAQSIGVGTHRMTTLGSSSSFSISQSGGNMLVQADADMRAGTTITQSGNAGKMVFRDQMNMNGSGTTTIEQSGNDAKLVFGHIKGTSENQFDFNQSGNGFIQITYGSNFSKASTMNFNQTGAGIITIGGAHNTSITNALPNNHKAATFYTNGFEATNTTYTIDQENSSGTVNLASNAAINATSLKQGANATLNINGTLNLSGTDNVVSGVVTLGTAGTLNLTGALEVESGSTLHFDVAAKDRAAINAAESGNLTVMASTVSVSMSETLQSTMESEAMAALETLDSFTYTIDLIKLSSADSENLAELIDGKQLVLSMALPQTMAIASEDLDYTITQGLQVEDNVLQATVTWQAVKAGEQIPEPATATLSLLALAGLAARRRRR